MIGKVSLQMLYKVSIEFVTLLSLFCLCCNLISHQSCSATGFLLTRCSSEGEPDGPPRTDILMGLELGQMAALQSMLSICFST